VAQAEFHNNRSLFSDYYLSELVQRDPHWQSLVGQAWQTKQQVSEILESALPEITPNTPKAELEHRVVRPLLDSLGHHYRVQKNVRTSEGQKYPDYALFSAEYDAKAATAKVASDFYRDAIAIGEAKR